MVEMTESELENACPEIYHVIKIYLRNYVNNNRVTADQLIEEVIQDTYNGDQTFTKLDSYDPCVLCVESMFEIVKVVSKICREEYDMTFNIETIEKTIDLYAYLCAKEIGHELIDMYHLDNEDPNEDYNHHNDENDTEIREI